MRYTLALLAVNAIVFAAYAQAEVLGIRGIMYYVAGTPVSWDQLFPNIITYMFGHVGLLHLLMNMFMLLLIGRNIEGTITRQTYDDGARNLVAHKVAGVPGWVIMVVYFAAGMVGAIAHMMFSDVPLIGASAAVSGLVGAAFAYRIFSPGAIAYFVIVLNIIPLLGVMSIFEVGDPGVSYISHLGGAVAGFGVGLLFSRLKIHRLGSI